MADAQLDHVVLLVPYKDVTEPPAWLGDNFIISPGGRHADGKTENRLILFRDGTYLELIAFIDDSPEHRHGHWWDKPYGVVDFAFTTPHGLDHPALNERLARSGTGIAYTAPQEGGRRKPDGQEIQWQVTFPTGVSRGSVPFWCHDVTPRQRRVPTTADNTRHPCGAAGMAGVTLRLADEGAELPRLTAAMAAVLAVDRRSDARYTLNVPREVAGAARPSIRLSEGTEATSQLSLILQSPKTVSDIHHHVGDGVVSIIFEHMA